MLDLVTEASTLGALLEDTRGVVGVVLGTIEGEVRATLGSVRDSGATAAVGAALVGELEKVGMLLGLGEPGVATLKAASSSRVFAHQSDAVLVIELDPKRPLGELETKLRNVAWAPPGDPPDSPAISRAPTNGPFASGSMSHGTEAEADADAFEDDWYSDAPVPVRPNLAPLPPPLPSLQSSLPPVFSQSMTSSGLPTPALQTPPPVAPPPPTPPPRAAAPARQTQPPALGSRQTQPPPPTVSGSGAVKTVGSGAVFAGDLEEFALPDLLEFLRNSHRTGLLICSSEIGVGTIQLSRGMIVGADSPNALDLRRYFLASADLTPEQRRSMAALPEECFGGDLIVDELASRNLAPRDEVERARVARIYSAFREMMAWNSGRFSFDPAVPVASNPALALSAQTILMEIYQEQDEQSR